MLEAFGSASVQQVSNMRAIPLAEWTAFDVKADALTASVTIAAVPGMRHVIRSLHATLSVNGAAPVFNAGVLLSFGAVPIFEPHMSVNAPNAPSDAPIQLTGLEIAAPVNTAITWTFTTAAIANIVETCFIAGYSIPAR